MKTELIGRRRSEGLRSCRRTSCESADAPRSVKTRSDAPCKILQKLHKVEECIFWKDCAGVGLRWFICSHDFTHTVSPPPAPPHSPAWIRHSSGNGFLLRLPSAAETLQLILISDRNMPNTTDAYVIFVLCNSHQRSGGPSFLTALKVQGSLLL